MCASIQHQTCLFLQEVIVLSEYDSSYALFTLELADIQLQDSLKHRGILLKIHSDRDIATVYLS
jgi:hypothetical protein